MVRIFFFTLSMLIACDELIAQTKEAGPHFEVASIKASDEGREYWPTGGPGTKEPTNFSAHTYLGVLLRQAFNLEDAPGQEDMPAWLWQKPILFLLTARVSPDATKEQIPLMLQAFLKERFHLAYHFEKREVAGYRMVVAKNGLKIKPSADSSEAAELTPATKIGKDGFPNTEGTWNMGAPVTKYFRKNQSMGQIAAYLGHHFRPDPDKPVVDATGLTGKYDITLYWQAGVSTATADSDNVPATPGSGQPMLVAVQSQLGLKLEPAKLLLNVFVLDHMDKTPTEN